MSPQDWTKKLSLVPRPLRYKLMVAFSLMSVIPLLITGYLVNNYIFPQQRDTESISLIVLICIFIAILGLMLAKGIVDPITKLANHAQIIARGDFETKALDIKREDEIGQLSTSLNDITRRIRANMDELKNYGERTKQINLDIHKKVLALSSLLQIGNLISTKAQMEEILNLIGERVAQVLDTKISFFMLVNEATNELEFKSAYQMDPVLLATYKAKLGRSFLGEIADSGETYILDAKRQKQTLEGATQFLQQLGIKNLLILPVTSHGQVIGILGAGSALNNFVFNDDDLDLVKVFIKQITIAIENEELLKKAQELEIKDELTDLYNASYIRKRLDEEIKRAILLQRPCSFVLVNIDNFRTYRDRQGELASESTLKKIARILEENATDIDRVGRFGGDEFALVLPEKNKKEASVIAEEVRRRIEESIFPGDKTSMVKLTVSAGVSENPIDGINALELVEKATQFLKQAKSQGKNKVMF